MQVEVDHLTRAEVLRVNREFIGRCNASRITIEGASYGPGDLVFQGFVGSIDLKKPNPAFTGHYRFRLAQPRDIERDIEEMRNLPRFPVEETKPETETLPGEADTTVAVNLGDD